MQLGGWDTHASQVDNATPTSGTHAALFSQISEAVSAFYDATIELGAEKQVTLFTASDFGRTYRSNGDGSDHGWGSMHFMLGGAVKGRRFYGVPPIVASNGQDDVGQGRLLPTTSVDQYAATLGKWFGLTEAQLLGALPNLSNYAQATRDIGFMS